MADGSPPQTGLPPVLDEADLSARLSSADGLLLGLDFDGTLTAVREDPAEPEITPSNRRALRRLSDVRTVRVAVISGRALSDLRDRVGVDGITYAGNHGLERYSDGTRTVAPAAQRHRPLVQRLVGRLEDRLDSVDGCFVEDKGLTTTIHYREVADDRTDDLRALVGSIVSERAPDRVQVQHGKAAIELRPAIPVDKGTVVSRLAEEVGGGWLTVYIGDDTTDEDVFETLPAESGLGIHVGADPETAADRRLPDPAAVEHALSWLAEEGAAMVTEPP